MLLHNLLYHRFAGVDTAFVFFDRTTDDSAGSVSDLPFARLEPSVDPATFKGVHGANIYVDHADSHAARQCLNVMSVLRTAADDGFDWIIHVDADELLATDKDESSPGFLKDHLAMIRDDVECVRFLPFEVCPTSLECDHPFASHTNFIVPGARRKRTIQDAMQGGSFNTRLSLGHRKGKRAIRTSAGLVPRGPHEFVRRDRSEPNEVTSGRLLHYYITGFSHFVQKFENMADRPDMLISGKPISRHKRMWRDMVNQRVLTKSQLRDHFERNVLLSSEMVARCRKRPTFAIGGRLPAVVEITSARDVFRAIDACRESDGHVDPQAFRESA